MNNKKVIVAALIYSQFAFAEDVKESPAPTNQEVLKDWQDKSGQTGTISDKNGGTIEWHGQATTDVYNINKEADTNNSALSGLGEGTFMLNRLQGDLRDIEQAGDVNYIQGGVSNSNDRAVQNLYRTYITNLQLGRAGVGYQMSAGDVVADFSKIGSNLGLRGLFGTKQLNALTVSGYAGVVTESWDSLFNRTPMSNQPARSRFLRDVTGFKANYNLNDKWSLFGTAQSYGDRDSSIDSIRRATDISQNGVTGTAGFGYKNNQAALSVELGTSHTGYDVSGAKIAGFGDAALLIDGQYAWQTVNLHAGYHNIGAFYTALSSNVVPGVRESYVGGDWFITPSLSYGNNVRRAETKTGDLAGGTSPINLVYSLSNRLAYNVTQIPSLNFSLQDMRNWGEIQTSRARNATTQFGTSYSNQHYSGNLALSHGNQKSNASPDSDSVSDAIQLSAGRQFVEGEFLALPRISGGIQLIGGYQQQRIANGTKTYSSNEGVTFSAQSLKFGQIQLVLTNLDTHQPNGRPTLNTKTVNFDWGKAVTQALSLKAYVRSAFRNHGDSIQAVDENVVGFQGDYKW